MYWKRKVLSSTYEIYAQDMQRGWLRDNVWKSEATGEMDGQKILYKSRGFFKSHTDIINLSTGELLGRIRLNSWLTKADILLEGKRYQWQYDNTWQTRWSMMKEDGTWIKYQGREISGIIDGDTSNSLALLTGLYTANDLKTITFVIILVPLFVVIFSGS